MAAPDRIKRCSSAFTSINIKDGEEVKEILSQSVERERIARRVSTRENMIDVSDYDDWD